MSGPRTISILFATLLLAFLPGTAAAQSAGDEQYADPLTQTDPAPTNPPSLTPEPDQGSSLDAEEGSTDSGSSTPAPSPPAGQAAEQAGAAQGSGLTALPNTGADTGELALIGGVLVLFGVGLRLRTADARP